MVDIGIDQDQDGIDDRVAVDIIRPSEPQLQHRAVPAIMDTSGYYQQLGRGNETQTKTYDASGRPVQFPLFLDNFFVPRGYAVVMPDLAGTNRSTGCTDYGGPSELLSSTKVIDWLNGRAVGYASPLGTARRTATWATGSVGMIGKSWDGQNAVETAVTGIAGLDAVVPESAVTSDWTQFRDRTGSQSYFETTADYTLGNPELQNARALHNPHCQALLRRVGAGEPLDGTFTNEWYSRDWAPRAGQVTAAVLMTQGQNDTTVFPTNLRPFWSALPAATPKRLWLSEVGHIDPFDFRRAAWVDLLHRWFDRFLFKIPNGVDHGPQLSVERAPDQWVDYPTFPAAGTSTVTLRTTAATPDAGALTTGAAGSGTLTVPRNSSTLEFTSPPLTADTRLSGSVDVVVGAETSTNQDVRYESELVDLGTTTTRGFSGRPDTDRSEIGIRNSRTTQTCWGESRSGDSGCFYVTPPDVVTVDQQVIGWGTRDLQHHSSVQVLQPVHADTAYTMQIPLYSLDRIVPAGHRLALVVYAYPARGATASVDLATTALALPVVGGELQFSSNVPGPPAFTAPLLAPRIGGPLLGP